MVNDGQDREAPHPPSSFPSGLAYQFPFQSHPGNPDPGAPSPYPRYGYTSSSARSWSRRSSIESMHTPGSPPSPLAARRRASLDMENGRRASFSIGPSYHHDDSPPTPSPSSFKPAFLSPTSRNSLSRPGSIIWSPPSQGRETDSPSASCTALALQNNVLTASKTPQPSTRLTQQLTSDDKPWCAKPSKYARRDSRISYGITVFCILLGILGAAATCFFGWTDTQTRLLTKTRLCPVLEDRFDSGSIDTAIWSREVASGWGSFNKEFHMTTNSDANSFVRNGQLYILPTLSSRSGIDLNGKTYSLPGCDSKSLPPWPGLRCGAVNNPLTRDAIPPVLSAKLTTRKSNKTITFSRGGRVSARVKFGKGDWLTGVVGLEPANGSPLEARIQVASARFNNPSYPAQGNNFVTSSLTYNPIPFVGSLEKALFGWWQLKRTSFSADFHTYTLEWGPVSAAKGGWMRVYIDDRLQATLSLSSLIGKNSFWGRGGYEGMKTTKNGTSDIIVSNPWGGRPGSAPFDGPFYLSLGVTAGGCDGWFPDNVGDKPWVDATSSALRDFTSRQFQWENTWPENEEERAMKVDSVGIWEGC